MCQDNARAVDVIHSNGHLWHSMGGPDPEQLFRPITSNLEMCKEVAERLAELKSKDDRDGVQEFCDELIKAVDTLKSLEWNDIRVERFNMTPPALFSELAPLAVGELHYRNQRGPGFCYWVGWCEHLVAFLLYWPLCVPEVRTAESLLCRQAAEIFDGRKRGVRYICCVAEFSLCPHQDATQAGVAGRHCTS